MNIADHIDIWTNEKNARKQWEDYWQELADILLPKRADITTGTVNGEDRVSPVIFDAAPMRARRGLATALDGLLKPKTTKWFSIRTQDDDINDDDEAKRWMEIVEERMWRAIYSKNARFIQRSGEVDNDLVALGTGVLYTGESKNLRSLKFISIHPKDVIFLEDGDGIIDTLYFELRLTARQAAGMFGEKNLGSKTLESFRSKNASDKQTRFPFLFCVYPRLERNPKSLLNTDLPFAKVVIDKESEHIVEESGFHEFPFAVPRWDTATGEKYGRSPGMIALPDAKTLQAMGKTLLVAGQKAVDPPLLAYDDSIIGAVRTFPGGITTIDIEAVRGIGGSPVQPLNFGTNIPLGREMQNDTRQAVEAAFFRNIFNLPVDGPQMTATEILERKEEFIREIGPVFGRLETDYIGSIVDRVFGIMMRAGAFPEPPEILQGRDINFEFQSPIVQARKQIEAAGAARAIDILAPFVQVDPSIMDNFDGDKIARDTPDIFGIPMDWIRSNDEVSKIRQERAQAQQAQESMAMAQQTAEIAQGVQDAV